MQPNAFDDLASPHAFRQQIGLLEKGMGELEVIARRSAVDEMNAQTQFLAEVLGKE